MTKDNKTRVLLIEDSMTCMKKFDSLVGRYVPGIEDDMPECDLIILDLMLEKTRGVESVTACRRLMPRKPIVVMTSVDDPNMQADCLLAGSWITDSRAD